MLVSAPGDYGFTPGDLAERRVAPLLPPDFAEYWQLFREEVAAAQPRPRGCDAVEFTSLRGVRIAMRVDRPADRIAGMLLILHGAEVSDDIEAEPPAWAQSLPMAIVRVRVRGFPPSHADDPARHAGVPWILRDIEDPGQWIVRGAVGDVLLARRAALTMLSDELPPHAPWMLEGTSLGGGLAIIAAAQAALLGDPPARLAISLPSLGDWDFRTTHVDLGFGGMIAERLRQLRGDGDRIRRSLALCDAVHHAFHVQVPLLARLAHRDEVVPAPAAYAVTAAIGSAERALHYVTFGHYDGGLADLRRHAQFERRLTRFLDPDVAVDAALGDDAAGAAAS